MRLAFCCRLTFGSRKIWRNYEVNEFEVQDNCSVQCVGSRHWLCSSSQNLQAKMGNKITRRCSVVVDERYTRPQGLYPQRDVDQKKLRRLILDSKLAPCFPGEDEPNADYEECPICFLVSFLSLFSFGNEQMQCRPVCMIIFFILNWSSLNLDQSCSGLVFKGSSQGVMLQCYPSLNRSKCCSKGLCTGVIWLHNLQ